ncbi:UbiX family flavin prenyltransferase [Geomesophilobacter sediminis]|uniref:Flavin prenyltransferase UbiX n=1 Tax=Geomesophilobacter sediminis TaxID=2798584 RepID=A0A8J7IQ55_9BACT|nr:flavin prenyltransferase UbiX [Geomesophilobacter sediminis]MBJ6724684.1 UbiX family flavin prenyltransferase [Geomesophilobacter sediminis]
MKRHFALALTGASGAIYGLRLTDELLKAGHDVTLLISSAGFAVLKEECGLDWADDPALPERLRLHFGAGEELNYYGEKDLLAPIASGSRAPDAMVVVPCSMGTLSRVACGNSGNLLERVADVMLKENRPLLMVPRETPLNAIHLEHMLKLARLGVRIVPAMPAFYQHPETLDDLVDFVVGKILDALGVENALFRRWGNPS